MKKIEWENPDKMKIETGHATFDRQTNIISTGNLIANTVFGWHIRPYNETKCFHLTRKPGQLRAFDMAPFSHRIPRHVKEYVYSVTVDEPVWLYEFFHYNGNLRIVHGYIVTAKDHGHMQSFVIGPTQKSAGVIYECEKYVSWREVPGAPFQVNDRVRVISITDSTVSMDWLGRTGTVEYLDYACGCGQTYPDDPMIGVRSGSKIEEFWAEELEAITPDGTFCEDCGNPATEQDGFDAVCENCGEPAYYDSELCLCPQCEQEMEMDKP